MEKYENLRVQSCKYDGQIQREWQTQIQRREGTLLVLEGIFAEEVIHPILGTIAKGTLSTEYFWMDRWYGIFCFREGTGQLRNYYCNINTPPRLEEGTLSFVDLDFDILVYPDLSYKILDEEEFAENSFRYNYPVLLRENAQRALKEVTALIENRGFPFL